MSMLDYHNHLEKGDLTHAHLEQFALQARRRGVREMGISEHSYMFSEFRPLYERQSASAPADLAGKQRDWLERGGFRWRLKDYFALLQSAQVEGVEFRIGLEVDYFPGAEKLTSELLAGWSWDYLIGSVHWVDDWIYDLWSEMWSGRDVRRVWARYFEIAEEAVRSGLFDILGHPDSIKVFGHRPTPPLTDEMARLVEALAEREVAAELNTAFRYRGHSSDFCPDPEFLRLAARRGVRITLGSDAHLPGEAGLLLE
ncbi:MAG: histidinol-phosphatase, partial [Bacillota bacterium]